MKDLKFAASVVNLVILISCSISCSSVPPAPAGSRDDRAVAAGQTRARCVPGAVATGKASVAGAADPEQHLRLAIHLPTRNQDELTRLLHDLYDPKSPNFHKYLSVPEFTERFAPTAADYTSTSRLPAASYGVSGTSSSERRSCSRSVHTHRSDSPKREKSPPTRSASSGRVRTPLSRSGSGACKSSPTEDPRSRSSHANGTI